MIAEALVTSIGWSGARLRAARVAKRVTARQLSLVMQCGVRRVWQIERSPRVTASATDRYLIALGWALIGLERHGRG